MEQDPALPRWQPTCFAGQPRLRFETDNVELQAWLSCQPGTSDASDADSRTMAVQLWADDALLLAAQAAQHHAAQRLALEGAAVIGLLQRPEFERQRAAELARRARVADAFDREFQFLPFEADLH